MNIIIEKFAEKVKRATKTDNNEFVKLGRAVFWTLVLVLTASLSFGLGRLSKIEERREPIKIEMPQVSENLENVATVNLAGNKAGEDILTKPIVASKRGKKYHYIWCAGAKTIKEENKLFFATEIEAERAGYTLAANCQK